MATASLNVSFRIPETRVRNLFKVFRIVMILLLCHFNLPSSALELKGKIELGDEWQPVLFLASLGSPEDLFVASPDFVIAETFVQPDGSFSLKTDNVPVEPMFYRLYMVRGDHTTVEFNTSSNKNYLHLLLKRNSQVELVLEVNESLGVKELKGSPESKSILEFDRLYQEKEGAMSGNISKAKSSFLSHEMETFIRQFVEETPNVLVGLYALYHIDGKETHFLQNSEFYFNFQKRLEAEAAVEVYVQAFDELLKELVGFRDFVCQMPGVQPKWKDQVLIAQSIIILLMLVVVVALLVKIRKMRTSPEETQDHESLYNALTTKQQEILKLLAEGKSNKEIALELFVELSTVKTHINNIYRQLGVSSRQQALVFFQSIHDKRGV